MELRDVKSALALAVHRRALVRRVGLLTFRGWAQHIVDRWRDAASNRLSAPQAADIDLALRFSYPITQAVAATAA